jgi:hypothetical protein
VDRDVIFLVGAIVAIIILIIALFARRRARWPRDEQAMDDLVAEICREWKVPDVPFHLEATVHAVVAGITPGIPPGHWWTANGIEQSGRPLRTRLLRESNAADLNAIQEVSDRLFDHFGRDEQYRPNFVDGRRVTTMPGLPKEILFARIPGRQPPIDAWIVAVPPATIGASNR